MNQQEIALQRLHCQRIASPQSTSPSEVVTRLGAIQGQDYTGAKWSIGLRIPGSTDADIEQAIADKTIIRTWAMRGTLHIVAAADLRWLLALLAPRLITSSARRYRELELDEPTLARSNMLLAQALENGKQLNRTALLGILEDNGISTQGQRSAYMLQRASLNGLICQGAAPRNNPIFMALDESFPQGPILKREEAVAELAKRYITSRAPVTLKDFVAWSGLPITDAREGLESIKSELASETIDGQIYWMPQNMPPTSDASRSVYLLPGFDEYLLGYRGRSASLDPQYADRIVPGGNGIFNPTIVSNGRVVGTWRRTFKKDMVVFKPQPFHELSETDIQGMQAAATRYGVFLGMVVVVQ